MEICQTEELFCLRNPNNEANEVAQSFVLVHLHHPGSLAKPLREPGAPKPPLSTSLAAFVIFAVGVSCHRRAHNGLHRLDQRSH